MEYIVLLIALFGGIPGAVAIWKHFAKTSIKITFNEKQSFVCKIESNNKEIDGKYCFGFYDLTLVGAGEFPTTPKAIKFSIKHNNSWIEGHQIDIHTSIVKENIDCAVLKKGNDKIALMNWSNFTASSEPLDHGHLSICNVIFCIDLDFKEIELCKKMKFSVKDYLGKNYNKTIIINSCTFAVFDKDVRLLDKIVELSD